MRLPTIRPMAATDIDQVTAAFGREGWGDRRTTLEFVTRHPETHPLVADIEGEIVGTGVATVNGTVGWIGTIWVDPDRRRRGIGMALTRATIEAAESAGCRTLVLVATEAGRRLYEPLGFEVDATYRIIEALGTAGRPVDPRIRPFRDADLGPMTSMANEATGEDRGHLLRAFASPETARCLIHADGSIGGFTVRAPWSGGQTIAPGLEDAVAMLDARRAAHEPDERVRAGLVEANREGLERLLSSGWTDAWQAPRMIRGEPIDWQPRAIWGQFSFAIG
jgi:predicted N-acetyltransferase YhbS